jgi:exosortase
MSEKTFSHWPTQNFVVRLEIQALGRLISRHAILKSRRVIECKFTCLKSSPTIPTSDPNFTLLHIPLSLILNSPLRSAVIPVFSSHLVLTELPTARPPSGSSRVVPSPAPLWQIGILAAVSLWLYWTTISHLVRQWWSDPNFSHGFFVPLFAAFVIWQERDRLAALPRRPSWSGLGIVALALTLLIIGQLGAELFLARFSLLVLLAGTIVLFAGWNFFRALLFPWAFLLLMIPIPSLIFNQITFPLQLQASRVATFALRVFGVPILREGNIINLPAMSLEVAEACSGIRSLMTLLTLAIIYGYLAERRVGVRWILALSAIPIAIVANSVRIIGTGLLVQYWNPEKAEGYFHASWGLIIFVLSLLMLYLLHMLIRFLMRERGGNPPSGKEGES